MSYFSPASLSEALDHLATAAPAVVAGGTDLYPALGDRPAPASLLDLTRIAEMRGIRRTPQGLRIGACTTWAEIAAAGLPHGFDGLRGAAREVGSIQIQNAGTLAGNLCNASPAADGVPPLLTLHATVELASRSGTRSLSLQDFILGVRKVALRPDELLVAVHLPDPPAGARGSFLKLGARRYMVISIAMVAALVWRDDDGCIAGARIAVGACSPVACRLPRLERALVGLAPDDLRAGSDLWHDPIEALSPINDIRGSAEYRRDVVAELCRRAVLVALQRPEAAHE